MSRKHLLLQVPVAAIQRVASVKKRVEGFMLNSSMLDNFAFVSMCSDYAQLAGWCTQACLCMKSKRLFYM